MKLLSVGLARALWFMDVNELNPGGKDLHTHLFPSLLEDYKFRTYPKQGDDLVEGMKFTLGEWVRDDGTVLPLNVTIFKDGIAADTWSSTKDSEEFLEAVLGELPGLGFAYDPEMVRRKAYLSQLNVKCSKQLHALNPGLAEFAGHVSSVVDGTAFDLAAIELWPDQAHVLKPANFSFQRKIGEPLDSDRYWSQAPVPTDTHLELLEHLESLLSGQPA
ncbi:MAG: hypothetical protein ABSC05_26720 [Candidatus Solibacter sp.]|jgi:hypothetical protein